MGRIKLKGAIFVLVLSLSAVGCAFPSKYYRGFLGSDLRPGMTQKEVKAALGEPAGFHRQQLSANDLREVWVYHVQNRNLWTNHLYPKSHLIVFSNGVMLAKDPNNPYAARNQF